MSITQEQFDALKPGDRVRLTAGWIGEVVAAWQGYAWVRFADDADATAYGLRHIDAIIPPASRPVAWVNLDADATLDMAESRHLADKYANPDRTHVITIYSDGSTTTEAVS